MQGARPEEQLLPIRFSGRQLQREWPTEAMLQLHDEVCYLSEKVKKI